jgi:hypothetical protein
MALATSIPIILLFIVGLCCFGKIAVNVLQLGEVADFEALTFILALNFI